MNEDECAKLLSGRPQRFEAWIIEILPHDVGSDHGAAKSQAAHGAPQLIRGLLGSLHRQRRYPDEAARIPADMFRDLVVLNRRYRRTERRLLIVKICLRSRGQHLHFDAHRIHVSQAVLQVEAAFRKWAVGHAAHLQQRGGIIQRSDGHRHLRSLFAQQGCRFLRQHMGMRIDYSHFTTRKKGAPCRKERLSAARRGSAQGPVVSRAFGYKRSHQTFSRISHDELCTHEAYVTRRG